MPIYNEEDFIARSLRAVLTVDYPPALLEVLIADGMSTDATRAIIAETAAQHPDVTVTVLDNPQRSVPAGLNLLIKQAQGEVIVRVDGHTIIEPDYVRQCVAALQRTDAVNVGGRMDATGCGRIGEAIALATSSPFGVGGARFHYSTSEEWVDTVYMGAWRRATFHRAGLFDEEMVRNQDDEFNYRLRAMGERILLCPSIRSRYYCRSSLRSLFRQYFQYGLYKVRVLQKHPRQMRLRQFVPAAFVVAIIGTTILAIFCPVGRAMLAALVGIYALSSLTTSVHISQQHGWRHLPILPIAFATLHVSYGLGFLTGLARFWRRWGKQKTQTTGTSNHGR